MTGLLGHAVRRSSSGRHDLLPATGSHGAILISFSTLFAWTLGSGAIIWRIWPTVLLHTLFATAITVVSLRTQVDLGVSNMMLTVLGVVIGFVISYRFSCGYEQYWMGRTAWSDVVKHTQTLMRLIWFHVPLRLTPKTPQELGQQVTPSRSGEEMEAVMKEKRVALDLLEGFAVSLKHHLRGELGIFYQDLYNLVKPLHEVNQSSTLPHHTHSVVTISPTVLDPPSFPHERSERDPLIPPKVGYGAIFIERERSVSSGSSVPPPLLPAGAVGGDRTTSLSAYMREIFTFYRSSDASDEPPRRWTTGVPASGQKVYKRIASGDENLPLEILRLLSDWFAVLEERGTVPGTTLGGMIGTIAALEDCLSTAERTLTTPLPLTVWLYLFFLPFQLVAEFSWYTIPGVAIAAFIYLGFLAAGDEIGQPFGAPSNDLDLDLICREMIHADLSRLRETPGVNVFLGPRVATPR
ncbi:UPF0187-domain-containing protein [Russula earlei]|uniref:UPF0187-domain-containing protein n=1 Tax=Russula earlei TaxID=71964 RepID=A0ACC0U5E2_9AGAM|nr:UPF0187-domain-containing protein [Russula earlei]